MQWLFQFWYPCVRFVSARFPSEGAFHDPVGGRRLRGHRRPQRAELRSRRTAPRHGEGRSDARRRGCRYARSPRPRRRLLRGDGRQRARADAVARRHRRPQHVDGVDRRQRQIVGSAHRRQPRHVRSAEDDFVTPADSRLQNGVRAPQPLSVPRPRQRAVLQGAGWSRSESLRLVAGCARPVVPAGSVRGRDEISGREDRRARHHGACRLLLRRTDRHRRPAAVSQSGFRREGAPAVGQRAVLQRSDLLLRSQPRTSVSRRDVVRVLSRRAESDPSAGRSRESEMGEPERERRRAVLLVGSHLQLARHGQRGHLLLSGAARLAPRHARHVARLDRQHQQPPLDERGLQPDAADARGEEMGQGDDRRRRTEQQAVQRFRSGRRPAVAVLRLAGHDVDATRAEGRVRFGRRSRRPQPRVPEHRPVQRGVAAAFPGGHRRTADLADSDRDGAEELGLLAGHRDADAEHGALLPRQHRSPLFERRAGRAEISR